MLAWIVSALSVVSAAAATENEESASGGSEQDGGGSWYIPDWVNDLANQFREITQTFKDLMSGKLIKDAIDSMVVSYADEMLTPVYGAFNKIFLFTPRLAEIGFVQAGWSFFSILSLSSLFLAILVIAIKVIQGKKEMKTLLKVFGWCFLANFSSLTVMNFIGVGLNFVTQSILAGIIGTTDIQYEALSGEEVLKSLVVGIDTVTDPSYAGLTLGQLMADSEGGILTLVMYAMTIVYPLFLIASVKILVFIIMYIFVGVWISYAAFTGKLETLLGFLNIYIRTQIAGVLMATYWAVFVKSQSDYGSDLGFLASIGIPPVIATPLTSIALVVLLFYIWIKPCWKAARLPTSLNGGQAVETLGAFGNKSSMAINALGKRFGMENLQHKGLSWARSSERLAEVGRKMQERERQKKILKAVMTKGATEVLSGVKYAEPQVWENRVGSVVASRAGAEINYDTSLIMDTPSHEVAHQLEPEGFTPGAVIKVEPDQLEETRTLASSLHAKYGEAVDWNYQRGEMLVSNNEHLKPILQEFEKANIARTISHGYEKDGVFLDVEKKVVKRFSGNEETENTMNQVKGKLPIYSKVNNLSPTEATSAFEHLQRLGKQHPATEQVKLVNGELWIPDLMIPVMVPILQEMRKESAMFVRFDLPKGSQYIESLHQYIQSHGTDELKDGLEINVSENSLLVRESQTKAFEEIHKAYRQVRIPYWRTRTGRTMVIKDGLPVDNGQQPLTGMNMGSFEQLQADMIRAKDGKKGGGG
ncbi:hypothetical protein ABEW34_21565 [Paenibacillus algorifonticola]|uniref:hypothetical protein n=1 Tax=Paenibacillus algorifonticola TaxID=684063 RepID=UPI003D2AE6BF